MSYVNASPELMAAAATDVAAVGSTVNAAHMAAVAPTVGVVPAAADEVSAGVAQIFSGAAQEFHTLVGRAATFGEQFAQHLHAGAGSYAAAEAVNSASLVSIVNSIPGAIAALPGQIYNDIAGVANSVISTLSFLAKAGILPFAITYEVLVAAYYTLELYIGLLYFVLQYLGAPTGIP